MRQKLIVIVLLTVVAATVPLARATAPITVTINPPNPSQYAGFTVSGQFVGYGSGVRWYMYVDAASSVSPCVPSHGIGYWQGTTSSDGTYSAWINGQGAGAYLVTVMDDFGDNSGRVCFTIG